MPRKRIDLKSGMRVVKGPPADWDVPPIVHLADLSAWLGTTKDQLNWFANLNQRSRKGHYVSQWVRKRSGVRLLESPKPKLKAIQKQILQELLYAIPVSDCAHGFVEKRSVSSFVANHIGQSVCLKMDLKNFFPSIGSGKIYRLFNRLGYPRKVSRIMTGLCTTATTRNKLEELRDFSVSGQQLWQTYGKRHLPQGAPTSPALSNFCAFKMDCRLKGLAKSLGGRYSRYADDLLFSFNEESCQDRQKKNWLRRLSQKVAVIALEEGFDVNFRKTRLMPSSQRQMAAGIVLNEKPNLPREKYDTLKATLYNCVRNGPQSQNRNQLTDFRGHLAGKIAWVRQLSQEKADKLDALFQQIPW